MSISTLIHKSLTTSISPMVYIMMGVSALIGFLFFTGVAVGAGESILYSVGTLLPKGLWGGLLFLTAIMAEVGFFTKNDQLISLGGIGGFMVWLFASISLFMAGSWYVLVTVALFHLVFHGYVVLAASLGYIHRSPTH